MEIVQTVDDEHGKVALPHQKSLNDIGNPQTSGKGKTTFARRAYIQQLEIYSNVVEVAREYYDNKLRIVELRVMIFQRRSL